MIGLYFSLGESTISGLHEKGRPEGPAVLWQIAASRFVDEAYTKVYSQHWRAWTTASNNDHASLAI
jgi:hypothetical protein